MSGPYVAEECREQYLSTVMVPWINIGMTACRMLWHHIPSHQLWKWCATVQRRQNASTGPLHTYSIVIKGQIESEFVDENDLIPFGCSPIPSSVTPLQTEATMRECQWQYM
ncbi:hypothetical protein TNCV_4667361 [Trichonephila clavipes]|nr:hypothetical protein TNCV_4667361 [Trichonephila clavipes]